jgi:hypothetical protein
MVWSASQAGGCLQVPDGGLRVRADPDPTPTRPPRSIRYHPSGKMVTLGCDPTSSMHVSSGCRMARLYEPAVPGLSER